MIKNYFGIFCLALLFCYSCNSQTTPGKESKASSFVNNYEGDKIEKTAEEWRKILDEKSFYVIREKGTERPFTGDLLKENRSGTFHCKACNLALFPSDTKFKSGTGWPSFYEPLNDKNIATETDYHIGYPRTEVMCGRCEGHLGHVFEDGPKPTGLRYCINSVSLIFEPVGNEP